MNMKKIMILGLAVLAMLAVGCQKELTENEKALAELNEACSFLHPKVNGRLFPISRRERLQNRVQGEEQCPRMYGVHPCGKRARLYQKIFAYI